MRRVQVVDSHTGGEPTRVVFSGGPDLGGGPLAERVARFRRDFDKFRSAVVNEPRGSDALVGALLCAPTDPSCVAGVIYFNNVGPIRMCGHGTIGLVVTLAHLRRLGPGTHRIETPVGVVGVDYEGGNAVALDNVPSWRYRSGVRVAVDGHGTVTGDVAWGGNWFFLCGDHGQELTLANVGPLTDFAWRVRRALERDRVAGEDGEIDHIELIGPSRTAGARNFVLCPGGAYDRSPCGTGTSAKVACLAADGKLTEGAVWRQESITGSVFEATYRRQGDRVLPRLRGTAFVTAEAVLLLDDNDPLCWGLRP
jgi:4-hydroxyproline epimerase